MGALFVTLVFFIGGLCVCGAWSALHSLGIVPLPASGNLDGVVGLAVCIGLPVGIVLQLAFS